MERKERKESELRERVRKAMDGVTVNGVVRKTAVRPLAKHCGFVGHSLLQRWLAYDISIKGVYLERLEMWCEAEERLLKRIMKDQSDLPPPVLHVTNRAAGKKNDTHRNARTVKKAKT